MALLCYTRNGILSRTEVSCLNFPKLKNALLCRILVYVVVLGGFIAPIVIVVSLKFVPEAIKVIASLGLAVGLLIYLFKNFVLLMAMDVGLAVLRCHNTARKHFVLKIAEIDLIDSWDYPKSHKIAKATVKEIKNLLNTYFAGLGFTAKYISYE